MTYPELPICFCDCQDYSAGGGSISSATSCQWFTCNTCKRKVLQLFGGYTSYLLYTMPSPSEAQLDKMITWANRVFGPTSRDFKAQVEKAKDDAWMEFLPGFLARTGMTANEKGHITSEYPSDEALQEVRKILETFPDGFSESPCLAEIPENMFLYRFVNDWWVLQTHMETRNAKLPRDPIVVSTEKFFQRVFSAVGVTDYSPTPSQYYREDPSWYTFKKGPGTYTVGWRKRVVSISAVFETPQNLQRLEELADADSVTFESSGRWQPRGCVDAKDFTIHAWTEEKVVEYLKTAFESFGEVSRELAG